MSKTGTNLLQMQEDALHMTREQFFTEYGDLWMSIYDSQQTAEEGFTQTNNTTQLLNEEGNKL